MPNGKKTNNIASKLQSFLGDRFQVEDVSPDYHHIAGVMKQTNYAIKITHLLGDGELSSGHFILQAARDYEGNEIPLDNKLSGLKPSRK